MTTADLIQRLPALREMFPKEIQQDWSMEEWQLSFARQQKRTFAGLDAWREKNQSPKMENDLQFEDDLIL